MSLMVWEVVALLILEAMAFCIGAIVGHHVERERWIRRARYYSGDPRG